MKDFFWYVEKSKLSNTRSSFPSSLDGDFRFRPPPPSNKDIKIPKHSQTGHKMKGNVVSTESEFADRSVPLKMNTRKKWVNHIALSFIEISNFWPFFMRRLFCICHDEIHWGHSGLFFSVGYGKNIQSFCMQKMSFSQRSQIEWRKFYTPSPYGRAVKKWWADGLGVSKFAKTIRRNWWKSSLKLFRN